MSFPRKIILPLLISSFLFLIVCSFSTPQPQSKPAVQPTPQSKEIELPFQSIERRDWGGTGYPQTEPALIVVTSSEDMSNLASFISDNAYQALQDVNFSEDIVIGVFRGQQSVGPYEVNVDKVALKDDMINVYATFIEPNKSVTEAATSAYEIIVIEKSEQITNKSSLSFNLIANRRKITS